MFGNPQISATPVDDLYRSQADTYGNSFANPMNPANMNPGWGINSSLLTPSYTAGYRPGYSGSNGATDYNRAGFFSSLNKISPWSDAPNWGNPTTNLQDNFDAVGQRPVDAAMWGAQRIGLPVASFWASSKLMGGTNAFGMSKGAMGAGRAFGQGLGSGMARGFGMRGMAARGMAAGMGGLMGVSAGIAAPLLALQAAGEVADRGVFSPYMNTRRSAEDLRTNFSGITFGDSSGNVVTGGGLGGRESSRLASQITRDGIQDMNLSTGEYGNAASMVSRSGLADNVNSRQISKRVKDSVEQMKLIMSVASMPEMRDAIEQLSKLQRMGANVSGGSFSDASGTMRQLGSLASVAGTNVQRLMNTVGAQGQYLYQANGMTPHLGQLAAANSYASLSAGNRMGLISSSQLARMGGLDGATQASLTGQLNASQTLYNKMSNYNGYMGGGSSGSMIGNVTQYGQNMARDPMGAYGGMMLHGRQMAGRQMSERGSLALDDQIWQMMKNQPGMVDKKTGKVSIERATPYLMQMGMSEDQIHAYAAQRIAETDQGTYALSMKAMNRNLIEQQQQSVEQNTWYGGAIGRNVYLGKKIGRALTQGIADNTGIPMANLAGAASDAVAGKWNELWYGDSIKSSGMTIDQALGGKSANAGIAGFDTDKRLTFAAGTPMAEKYKISDTFTKTNRFARELNALKDRGDPDAIAYFNATTADERQKALNNITKKNKWSAVTARDAASPEIYKKIESELSNMPRLSSAKAGGSGPNLLDAVVGALKDTFFGSADKNANFKETVSRMGGLKGQDEFTNLQAAGLAYTAATKVVDGELLATHNIADRMKTDKDLQRLSQMTGITNPQDLLAYINKSSNSVADNKLVKLSTASLRSSAKGVAGLRDASARAGGGVYDDSAIETKHLDHDEKMRATLAVQEDAKMKMDVTERLKSGHLDFSSYQSTINALDNKETVKKFSDAVDKFVGKVEEDSKPSWWRPSNMIGIPTLPGGGKQKNLGNQAGNSKQ